VVTAPSTTSPSSSTSAEATSSAVPSTTVPPASPLPLPSPTTTAVSGPAPGLEQLVVAPAYTASPYRRDAFGEDWIDADNDCHNTRAEVLMTETLEPVTFNANGCTVATGRWVDPWDGFTSNKASDFQIDHMVPLADAWRSGASTWTAERRQAFAQNLTDPNELNALHGSLNTSKSDKTPDQWKPPDRSSWCRYANEWVEIKVTWTLTVTVAERAALVGMLASCG
jgi:hypothetical protein